MGGRGSLASRNTSISSKRKNELLKNAQEYLDSGAAGGYKGYDNTAYVDSIRPDPTGFRSIVDYSYTETWEDSNGTTHYERAYGTFSMSDRQLGIDPSERAAVHNGKAQRWTND